MIESDEIPLAPLDPPQLVEVRVHGVEEENYHLKKENSRDIKQIATTFLRGVMNPTLDPEQEFSFHIGINFRSGFNESSMEVI